MEPCAKDEKDIHIDTQMNPNVDYSNAVQIQTECSSWSERDSSIKLFFQGELINVDDSKANQIESAIPSKSWISSRCAQHDASLQIVALNWKYHVRIEPIRDYA